MLGVAAWAACAADTGITSGQLVQPLSGVCGVTLVGSRNYDPNSWQDGVASFPEALNVAIPTEIPVTSGLAGKGTAKLQFTNAGSSITCVYKGNGTGNAGGTAYAFKSCYSGEISSPDPDDNFDGADPSGTSVAAAGDIHTATDFILHVNKGLKKSQNTQYALTQVTLVMNLAAGTSCSDNDVCNGVETCNGTGACVATAPPMVSDDEECTADACDPITGVSHTRIDSAFCRGKANFHDRTLSGLGGNGRSCADCHMATDNFQLRPKSADDRFLAMEATGIDDPLFRPIDADNFRTKDPNDPTTQYTYNNLRTLGLIRVTIPLPTSNGANVKLVDPLTGLTTNETVVDVWRQVPSVFDVRLTGEENLHPTGVWPNGALGGNFRPPGPNPAGGFQLDARVGTTSTFPFGALQNQALGAFRGHAQIGPAPSQAFLDDIAVFENDLFSSAAVRALADNGTPIPPPAPGSLEEQGKAIFDVSCGGCHGGIGTSTPFQNPDLTAFPRRIPRYQDIKTACPAPAGMPPCPPALDALARTYEYIQPINCPANGICANGGAACTPNAAQVCPGSATAKLRITSSDPGRFLLTGNTFDIRIMDIPNLRGISRTAPYFVNNRAKDLGEVYDHYVKFFASVANKGAPQVSLDGVTAGRALKNTPEEKAALLAYLNTL